MTDDKRTKYEQRITQARESLKNLLTSLDEAQWQTPVISEGQTWSVADVVAHLVENEVGMSIHIYKIRQGRETVPENFDLEEWNAGLKKRMGETSPQALLQKMEEARAKTLEQLHQIEADQWSLQGRHPDQGLITIEKYYETIAGHDEHHLADIKAGLDMN